MNAFSRVGQTALVTGATSGAGQAIAATMGAAGTRVVYADRQVDAFMNNANYIHGENLNADGGWVTR